MYIEFGQVFLDELENKMKMEFNPESIDNIKDKQPETGVTEYEQD